MILKFCMGSYCDQKNKIATLQKINTTTPPHTMIYLGVNLTKRKGCILKQVSNNPNATPTMIYFGVNFTFLPKGVVLGFWF
jgi:hypothetical protein